MSDLFKKDKDDNRDLVKVTVIEDTSSINSNNESQVKVSIDLPSFDLCDQPLCGNYWERTISCISIFRNIENKSSLKHLQNKLKSYKGTIHKVKFNCEWNKIDKKWEPCTSSDEEYDMIPHKDMKKFLDWALKRARKSLNDKVALYKKMNCNLTEKDKATIKVPIQQEMISALKACCPFVIEEEYRIGKYRIDAYIPRLKMAIEIDENGHSSYDQNEEKEYETLIRDHGIVLIRFNPHQTYQYSAQNELIRIVWNRTMSPDFMSFRIKNNLF